MKTPKILTKVIIQHSKKCFMKGQANPWSGLTDGHYWANSFANENVDHGKHHVWHRVTCNDPKCPAIKAVHSSVLIYA